ncbi:MAG TPA: GYF domain-containing protein [Gemmataceae bacterium]|nr:GYF domain-containing protein [Gemmataceae bacterium]
MPRQWFYSHKGVTLGPVSGRQLKSLAATGGLQPEDLIWAEDTDPERATVAGEALDFANLRRLAQEVKRGRALNKELTSDDQLYEWTDEIDRLFRDPEEAQGPVPEWLRPDEPAPAAGLPEWLAEPPVEEEAEAEAEPEPEAEEPAVPVAPAVPLAAPVAPPAGGLLGRMGIDPVTEQVVDWGRLKAWLQSQLEKRPGELPVPNEFDQDPFQAARKHLAAWFDLPKNRERIANGDTPAVRDDPALKAFMSHFERYGVDKQARLWEFVDFLIETRRR